MLDTWLELNKFSKRYHCAEALTLDDFKKQLEIIVTEVKGDPSGNSIIHDARKETIDQSIELIKIFVKRFKGLFNEQKNRLSGFTFMLATAGMNEPLYHKGTPILLGKERSSTLYLDTSSHILMLKGDLVNDLDINSIDDHEYRCAKREDTVYFCRKSNPSDSMYESSDWEDSDESLSSYDDSED